VPFSKSVYMPFLFLATLKIKYMLESPQKAKKLIFPEFSLRRKKNLAK